MNKIDQAYLDQLNINPKFALKIYASIMEKGKDACEDNLTFVEAVRLVTQVFLRFEDYIHSNNLLQVARSEWFEIENLPWYQYDQLQILTKRVPKYILIHPENFLKKIQYLLKVDSLKSQIDAYLVLTLESVIQYLPYFDSSFRIQVRTFAEKLNKEESLFSEVVKLKIQELKEKVLPKALDKPNQLKVEEVDTNLDSYNLKLVDNRAMVLIIGDLAMKKHDVQGIAKDFGINHTQLEFLEYVESKQYPFRQLQYSMKYAGIILGPVPHMVSDLDGHTSLVTLLQSSGYPHTFVASQGGELKLSKQLLKKGFADVVANYNSKGNH